MTPSNPDNSKPLIYRIADAIGVFHLVAPVNHTHTYSDIPGLTDELSELWAGMNEKASQEDVTEALAGKQNILTFDSTPTADSTNPVTSGGVAAALADKQDALTFDSTPTANSTNPVTSGGVKAALNGKAAAEHTHTPIQVTGLIPTFIESDGSAIDMDDIIDETVGIKRFIIKNVALSDIRFGDLLKSGTLPVHPNINDNTMIEPNQFAIVTIYKIDKDMNPDDQHDHDLCYFVTLDGIFENI